MDDNARKFITDHRFEIENYTTISYVLTIDWILTEDTCEKKIVSRKSDNMGIELLYIEKKTADGQRVSQKRKITQLEYDELHLSSTIHIEKKRFEFTLLQNDILYTLKYDVFMGGKLCLLEVGAGTKMERDEFQPEYVKGIVKEVTSDMQYYGYRVIGIL